MANDSKDTMQPAGNATPADDAISRTSPPANDSALEEGDEDTRSVSEGAAPNKDDRIATPSADDASSPTPSPADNDANATKLKRTKQNELVQQPKDERETLQRVGGVIVVLFKGKVRNSDLTYQQQDEIPDFRDAPGVAPGGASNDKQKEEDTPKDFYLLPTSEQVLIPPRSRKGLLWKYDKEQQDWCRAGGKRWRPALVLRQFRKDTNEYTRLFDRTDMLQGLDPNNKVWFDKHNKQARQRFRNYAGEIAVEHTAWSAAEVAVLYREINAVVLKTGLDSFSRKFKAAFIQTVTDGVNAIGGKNRGVRSVGTRLRRQKGPIFELSERAQALKTRIDGGEKVSKDERYPKEAIEIPKDTEGQDQGEAEDQDEAEGDDDEDDYEAQDQEEGIDNLGESSTEELQRLEDQFVKEAMCRSMNDDDDVQDYADAEAIFRMRFRKGKRRHSHGEEETENKRQRSKEEDDAAQAEAKARARAPVEQADEDEEDVDDMF
jgi:hypothetical protein